MTSTSHSPTPAETAGAAARAATQAASRAATQAAEKVARPSRKKITITEFLRMRGN